MLGHESDIVTEVLTLGGPQSLLDCGAVVSTDSLELPAPTQGRMSTGVSGEDKCGVQKLVSMAFSQGTSGWPRVTSVGLVAPEVNDGHGSTAGLESHQGEDRRCLIPPSEGRDSTVGLESHQDDDKWCLIPPEARRCR